MIQDKAKLKILSLGYCFPPAASAEAYVSARILGNIPNCTIDHISADPALVSGRLDNSLDQYVKNRFCNIFEISASPLISLLNKKIGSLPFRPDRWIMLNRATFKKAMLLTPSSYDVIISRSQYHSMHLVALKLKRNHPKVPWIACFSDPWSGADHSRSVPFFSSWSKRKEAQVLSSADSLVFPTEGLAEFFARQHPKINILSKSHVIPHTIDPVLSPPKDKIKNDKWIGRCLGAFYGPRRVAPLLKAIRALKETHPELASKIKIELIGANEEVKHQIQLYDLNNYISVEPGVDWSDALKLMAQSDFLILVEAPSDTTSFYMPSKLVDYISIEKPIFAISPNGHSADIVKAAGGVVVSPNQSAMELGENLSKVKNVVMKPNSSKEFEVKIHGERLLRLIESLISDYKVNVF